LNANNLTRVPARARARIEAEQVDEAALQSVASWLRFLAGHYPATRARKLTAMAKFVEQHNERVAIRARNRRWTPDRNIAVPRSLSGH
jgi:hypothetical protein